MIKIRRIFTYLFFFLLGVVGGIWSELFLFPWLFQQNLLMFPQSERQVLVFPKETIIIEENKALKEALQKIEKSILYLKEGNLGLVLTEEGFFLTLSPLENKQPVSVQKEYSLFLYRQDSIRAQTLPFVSLQDLFVGKRVFLVRFNPDIKTYEITLGYLKAKDTQGNYLLSFSEKGFVFDEQARFVGISYPTEFSTNLIQPSVVENLLKKI